MTLRATIQKAIEAHPSNPEQAAIAACVVIEEEFGVSGNGWFDDDPVMIAHLGVDEDGDGGDDV